MLVQRRFPQQQAMKVHESSKGSNGGKRVKFIEIETANIVRQKSYPLCAFRICPSVEATLKQPTRPATTGSLKMKPAWNEKAESTLLE